MPYSRRIAHYSPGPTDFVSVISDRAVEGAWFELRRQGGCGPGEVRLIDDFSDRNIFNEGDWLLIDIGYEDTVDEIIDMIRNMDFPLADCRYLVIPCRPEGTDDLSEEELAKLVTRDSLIGTAQARRPEGGRL